MSIEETAQLHAANSEDDGATQARVVVGDGIAAVEIRPRPGHHQPRNSKPPEGNQNPRSAACFYDVAGGEIVRASVYIGTHDDRPTRLRPAPTNLHSEQRTDQ